MRVLKGSKANKNKPEHASLTLGSMETRQAGSGQGGLGGRHTDQELGQPCWGALPGPEDSPPGQ